MKTQNRYTMTSSLSLSSLQDVCSDTPYGASRERWRNPSWYFYCHWDCGNVFYLWLAQNSIKYCNELSLFNCRWDHFTFHFVSVCFLNTWMTFVFLCFISSDTRPTHKNKCLPLVIVLQVDKKKKCLRQCLRTDQAYGQETKDLLKI